MREDKPTHTWHCALISLLFFVDVKSAKNVKTNLLLDQVHDGVRGVEINIYIDIFNVNIRLC
jgi:hypothetical protein